MSDTTTQTNSTTENAYPGKMLDILDAKLRLGDWADDLERGSLVAQREKHYQELGKPLRDFVKDTAEKIDISRAVVQRLRRIGQLPTEVQNLLRGTKIASRQDLLVALNDKIKTSAEAVTLEGRLALARELIDNPPKYGPRTTPKTPVVDAPTAAEPAPELGIAVFEGLPIATAFPGGPRIHDLELGARLGYGRAREIRGLIKDLVAGGHLLFDDQRGAAPRGPRTTSAGPGGFWLDEEQALFVTTQAGTPIARTITRQVVSAFVAARRALSKPALDAELVGRLEAAMSPMYSKLEQLERRIRELEHASSRPMMLVPQIELEDAGYSMESMNKALIEKGFSIAESDTAIRSIAAKLKIIGDLNFGFWNQHSDRVARGASGLTDSWRFNDSGAVVIEPIVHRYCLLKSEYETRGETSPREKALQEVLDTVRPIGNGESAFLTRQRQATIRKPFLSLRGPN